MSLVSEHRRPAGPGAIARDAHGNPLTAPPAAVAIYDRAVDNLLRYHPDVIADADSLVTDFPDVAMGQALMAYLCLLSTDPADRAAARAASEQLSGLPVISRERMHVDAVARWCRGDWRGAARRLDDVLLEWPTDMLALLVGHQLDFYLGDQTNLRDRVGRSLGALPAGADHHGFVQGMHAFGLEETGDTGAGLDAGLAAIDAHADDVWAIHAVAHVHEVRGDIEEGIAFMTRHQPDWADGHLFTVHLWWHHALYLLEAGRTADVLDLYDRHIHNELSDGVPMELLDASSLLWRLWLDGVGAGDRFERLADAWAARGGYEDWYAFNDVHEVMALCGAGRHQRARDRLDQMAETAAAGGTAWTNQDMTARIGLPVGRALLALAEGRPDDALDDLLPIRGSLQGFGGSNAQRDVFQQTVIDAAVRGGRHQLASALLRERLSLRPSSVFGWSRRDQVARGGGDDVAASSASARATGYSQRLAAVVDEFGLRL